MRGEAVEVRARGLIVKAAHYVARRAHRDESEAREDYGMPRHVQQRSKCLADEILPSLDRGTEEVAPRVAVAAEPLRGEIERAPEHGCAPVVQGMREWRVGMDPVQPVSLELEPAEERRCRGHEMERQADVVDEARSRQLAGAAAP